MIGHVHKSLKDTQSPLSPVLFLLYIFLSLVSSPFFGCWSGGLRRPHWRLKPLCCICRYATYNACILEKGGVELSFHPPTIITIAMFLGNRVKRSDPCSALRYTALNSSHPPSSPSRSGRKAAYLEGYEGRTDDGRQRLRRRDQNSSLSHTPLSQKFTSFPRTCFPLMFMYMCRLMLNHAVYLLVNCCPVGLKCPA